MRRVCVMLHLSPLLHPAPTFTLQLGAVKGKVHVNEFLAADIVRPGLGKETFAMNVSVLV